MAEDDKNIDNGKFESTNKGGACCLKNYNNDNNNKEGDQINESKNKKGDNGSNIDEIYT